MTNTLMTDPEVLESRFPVRLENFSIRKGSGGKGTWTGGDGIRRVVKFLNPVTVTTLCSHRIVPPFGVAGGSPGMVGKDTVIRANGVREPQPGNTEVHLEPGDAFEMLTPGGGGWGEFK
jgi:5-oxoprolinase (ATP-hydrolysing)